MSDQNTACGSRADAGIQHFAPGRQQSRDHSVLNHGTGRSPIPGHNNFATAENGSQRSRKPRRVNRIQTISNDAPESGDTEYSSCHVCLPAVPFYSLDILVRDRAGKRTAAGRCRTAARVSARQRLTANDGHECPSYMKAAQQKSRLRTDGFVSADDFGPQLILRPRMAADR